MNSTGLNHLIKLKLKFASSSAIATLIDYCLYLILVGQGVSPTTSNLFSASTGMVTNFILQKKYVFKLDRKLNQAFLISIGSSLIGIVISTGLIYLFNKNSFFAEYQMITKAVVTGLLFFYNFYLKRFAFERKFL